LLEILKEINWIDIFFLILLLIMVYKGTRTGVGGQILSFIACFALIFASIGYYVLLSEAIFGFMLQRWAKPISFFGICVSIFIITKILERILSIAREGEFGTIEKVGGAFVAALRAFALFGLIGMFLLLIPSGYMHTAVTKDSKTCMFFINMDASIYGWMMSFSEKSGSKKTQKKEIVGNFLNTAKASTEY